MVNPNVARYGSKRVRGKDCAYKFNGQKQRWRMWSTLKLFIQYIYPTSRPVFWKFSAFPTKTSLHNCTRLHGKCKQLRKPTAAVDSPSASPYPLLKSGLSARARIVKIFHRKNLKIRNTGKRAENEGTPRMWHMLLPKMVKYIHSCAGNVKSLN